MTEYIEREEAYDTLTEYYHHSTDTQHGALREALSRVPAADVAPVVLCKDCKSCNTDIAVGGWYGMCAFWNGHSVMADDYCSRFQNKDSADMREEQR